jgi:hypothetical protein
LGRLGNLRAVESLILALGDKEDSVRASAKEALEKLGRGTVEPLIHALGDSSLVRRGAAEVLGKLGEAKWREVVKGNDQDIARLGGSRDPRAVPALVRALGDTNPAIRIAAAEMLGKLGEAKWQSIVKGDNQDFTRLGGSGDPRAVNLLIWKLRCGNKDAAQPLALLALSSPAAIGGRWNEIKALFIPHIDFLAGPSCQTSGGEHVDSGVRVRFPDLPPGLDF